MRMISRLNFFFFVRDLQMSFQVSRFCSRFFNALQLPRQQKQESSLRASCAVYRVCVLFHSYIVFARCFTPVSCLCVVSLLYRVCVVFSNPFFHVYRNVLRFRLPVCYAPALCVAARFFFSLFSLRVACCSRFVVY